MASVNAGGNGHHPDLSGRDGGSALTRLYDEQACDLHRYLARRLDPATADDLVAETFLIAWQQRHRYQPHRGTARAWLYDCVVPAPSALRAAGAHGPPPA